MAQWTSDVPADREYASIQLIRVPPVQKLVGISINQLILGCPTHWDGRRTSACVGTGCPHCRDGHAGRWHAYVPIYNQASGHIAVVQLTKLAAGSLHEEALRYGALRGLLLQIYRAKPRDNGRILLDARKLPHEPADLPAPIDVKAFMESIWNGQNTSRDPKGNTRQEPHAAE